MLWVGTSGWQYADWRGAFYPAELPQRRWLEHYAGAFPTVEVNNAFYRLPERATFADWAGRTPANFVVSVKMSRYLTHVRRLLGPAEPVARFLDRAAGLGGKLGPVLLQLPPTLRADAGLLDAALGTFPGGVRVVVEPRHSSWWRDEIREVLTRHGAALCWADRGSRVITPLWRTADFGYLRMHSGRTRPGYGHQAIDSWLGRADDSYSGGEDFFVYFNNDQRAAAVRDARWMTERAARHGRAVAG
jgi:uncharacterized protein YecE (DUF72 family)